MLPPCRLIWKTSSQSSSRCTAYLFVTGSPQIHQATTETFYSLSSVAKHPSQMNEVDTSLSFYAGFYETACRFICISLRKKHFQKFLSLTIFPSYVVIFEWYLIYINLTSCVNFWVTPMSVRASWRTCMRESNFKIGQNAYCTNLLHVSDLEHSTTKNARLLCRPYSNEII